MCLPSVSEIPFFEVNVAGGMSQLNRTRSYFPCPLWALMGTWDLIKGMNFPSNMDMVKCSEIILENGERRTDELLNVTSGQ